MEKRRASVDFFQKLMRAYAIYCKPLCQEMKLPQTAFDILMFLANNPKYQTARDIVEIRGIKANLVSINVEKLVQEGYLRRQPIPGDRRKHLLQCTEKAESIIERGHQIQRAFAQKLFENVEENALAEFLRVTEIIGHNVVWYRLPQWAVFLYL